MKKRKIAIISIVVALTILISSMAFQATLDENKLQNEIESKNQEKEEIITTFQGNENYLKTTGDGVVIFDTEEYMIGKQSLEISTKGDRIPEIVRITDISPPIDFRGKFLKAWLKISDRSAVDLLRITVSSDNFETSKNYWIHQRASSPTAKSFQDNKWSPITISLTQTTGTTDLSKIL